MIGSFPHSFDVMGVVLAELGWGGRRGPEEGYVTSVVLEPCSSRLPMGRSTEYFGEPGGSSSGRHSHCQEEFTSREPIGLSPIMSTFEDANPSQPLSVGSDTPSSDLGGLLDSYFSSEPYDPDSSTTALYYGGQIPMDTSTNQPFSSDDVDLSAIVPLKLQRSIQSMNPPANAPPPVPLPVLWAEAPCESPMMTDSTSDRGFETSTTPSYTVHSCGDTPSTTTTSTTIISDTNQASQIPAAEPRASPAAAMRVEEEVNHSSTTTTTTTTTTIPRPLGFHEWEVGKRYQVVRLLGHGSYGQVAEAYDRFMNRRVAIKRVLNIFSNETDARRIYREMYILRQMRHPDIITLLDLIPPKDLASFQDLYMVFEYVDTDLYKLILSPQYLSDVHIQTLLYHMVVALKYIHSADVIHRDMKPANILLNEDCSLKICDFGLARVVNPAHSGESFITLPPPLAKSRRQMSFDARDEEERLQRFVGKTLNRQLTKHVVTRWYRPPELILLQDYTKAVDVWSLGCIFAELLGMQADSVRDYRQRAPLFPGKSCYPLSADIPTCYSDKLDQLNVIFNVIGTPSPASIAAMGDAQRYLRNFPPKSPKRLEVMYPGTNPLALDLLSKMLQFDPEHRITVEETLEHPYLKGVRDPSREVVAPVPIRDCEEGRMDKAELKRRAYEEVQFYHRHSIMGQQDAAFCQQQGRPSLARHTMH